MVAFELPGERDVDEALVVAEVEVGLAAVVGDEHLAVLEGVHRAGVDVDVGVELLHRDPEATGLEESAERRGGEALAEAGGHTTGHEDVLRQDLLFPSVARESVRKATVPDAPHRATRATGDDERWIPCRDASLPVVTGVETARLLPRSSLGPRRTLADRRRDPRDRGAS